MPVCEQCLTRLEEEASACPQCGRARARVRDEAPPRQPAPEAEPPAYLGRYRVTAQIGAGNFAIVYRGRDDELDRDVAIKVLHRKLLKSEKVVRSFQNEAKILASLEHPGIVPIYDMGHTEDDLYYLVTKWVEGSDLKTRMKKSRPQVAEAVQIVAAVAEALNYAHQHGLVHRDVKPGNILIDSTGRPLLVDFGLALRAAEFGTGPADVGTPLYMSPEQARKEGHRVDARTDIYSLGVVFYELLTGCHPYRGNNLEALLEFIRTQQARPPSQIDESIPQELERIWSKATALRASDRYGTARDFADDLRHWLKQDSAPANAAPATTRPASASVSLRPMPAPIVPRGLRSFTEQDSSFFLELLPGPRDRDGLPESIRFWKTRLEETDSERAFRVGLMYGPSGCGKSSLLKAGLLPRLARHVRVLFVEAVPDQTEARILKVFRKHCPDLPADTGLVEALRYLRDGGGLPEGNKLVLVVDQFEQWLHAPRTPVHAGLIEALRQCDGGRVQCLLLVRDDFWLAVSRCMRELEIPLVEGENTALVDLFDLLHARKVLAEFGRAFGRLPADLTTCTPEQERFLDRALAGLAEGGKVIPVRLSLFAEMVKGRPWTPATLRDVGGAAGIGVVFLEETFAAPTAPAARRVHAEAARAVLQALLPGAGTNLKGQRARADLLAASGYARRPADFDDLMRLLDKELRLVTPAEDAEERTAPRPHPNPPPSKGEGEDGPLPPRGGGLGWGGAQRYQLTHDFLVPALRQWLANKERDTRGGRARLRLDEYAVSWVGRPADRRLPRWWEWLNIRLLTRRKDWNAVQCQMMETADRYYALRVAVGAALVVLASLGFVYHRHQLREEMNNTHAEQLVARIQNFHDSQLALFREDVEHYRPWVLPKLQKLIDDPATDDDDRLHARLVILPFEPGQVEPLLELALASEPRELLEIRAELQPFKERLNDKLWRIAIDSREDRARRLRAACLLALYAPADPRWNTANTDLVEALLAQDALYLSRWLEALRPVRRHFLEPLGKVFRDQSHLGRRFLAANILIDYAIDQPAVIDELLQESDDHLRILLKDKIAARRRQP